MGLDAEGCGRIEIGARFFHRAGNRALMMGAAAYLRTLDVVEGSGRLGRSK